jgi:hypothetical protein
VTRVVNNNRLNEELLRSQLRETLEEVQVSSALRDKTLDACRAYLESAQQVAVTDVADVSGVADAAGVSDMTTATPRGVESPRRLLPFAGRHATFFRIAGGLAAGVLLFLMVLDVMPRMGANAPAALARNDKAAGAAMESSMDAAAVPADSAAAAAPELSVSFSESATADTAGSAKRGAGDAAADQGVMAVAGEEDPGAMAEAGEAASDNSAAPDGEAASGSADPNPDVQIATPEGEMAEAPALMYTMGMAQWASYPAADGPQILSAPPSAAQVAAALTTQGQQPEALYGGMSEAEAPASLSQALLPVRHLSQPLSGETLGAASSWQDLLVGVNAGENKQSEGAREADEALGIWMLPVLNGQGAQIVPLRMVAQETGGSTLVADMPLPVLNEDGWVNRLTRRDQLQQLIDEVCGNPVTNWQVIDIDGGRGFWVVWQTDGTEWVLPMMDNPERLGLENGRAYSWEALVAIVGPLL